MSKHRKRYTWNKSTGVTPVEGVEFFWNGPDHVDVVVTVKIGVDRETAVACVWADAHDRLCAMVERLGVSFFKTQALTIAAVMMMVSEQKIRDRNKPPFISE